MPAFGGVTGHVYYQAWRVLPLGDHEYLPSALATYVHRVLTCRGDTPALDL